MHFHEMTHTHKSPVRSHNLLLLFNESQSVNYNIILLLPSLTNCLYCCRSTQRRKLNDRKKLVERTLAATTHSSILFQATRTI
jgi:hypothetical protein